VAGSIAHGWEKDDSDVDIMLVATDEEYSRRRPERAFHYFTRDFCNYPRG
jgi:predicted nucleotidyltransferase